MIYYGTRSRGNCRTRKFGINRNSGRNRNASRFDRRKQLSCVCIIERTDYLGRTSVKLVVMGCFQRGDERMKEELEYIFHLFLNLEDKNRLLSCKSAEEIERCMEVYYGK